MKKLRTKWNGIIAGVCTLALIITLTALADVPPPELSIEQTDSNQFNIVITNGITATNYTLFWTPVLEDPNFPWLPLWVSEVGETNFAVEVPGMDEIPNGFFRVLMGSDSDGDGILQQQDADSDDPGVGILSVTINSPTDGAVLQ